MGGRKRRDLKPTSLPLRSPYSKEREFGGVTKEELFRYLQKAEQRTANLRRILDDFEATPAARKQIKDILNQLEKEGKVAHHKGNRYEAPARQLIAGTIILH